MRAGLVLMRRTANGLVHVRDVSDRVEAEREVEADPSLRLMSRSEALRQIFRGPQEQVTAGAIRRR